MQNLLNIEFLEKWYFFLFFLVPIILYFFYKKDKSWINFNNLEDLRKVFKNNNYKFYLKIILLFLILINFILILANPNISNTSEKIKKNWIDIVITLDISGSMEANDLKPNRIEVAKEVINKFIGNFKTNRVGLVVYAWKPFTSIPLTFDYNILSENIKRLSLNNIIFNWTATGDALLMAKTLFKTEDKNREKVIILLTDWDANVWVNPILSGLALKKENIKVYTVWIWNKDWWYIIHDNWAFKTKQKMPPLNEKPLIQIAEDTWWKYFRADNNKSFENIFKELNKLEKNDIEIEVKKEYSNYYKIFLYSLIILIWSFCYLVFRSWK